MHVKYTIPPCLFVEESTPFKELDRNLTRERKGDTLNGFGTSTYKPSDDWKLILDALPILLVEFPDPTVWKEEKLKELIAFYDTD